MVLLDQMVFSGNSFLSTILLTKILGISNFGVYASIVLFVYLVISVLNAIIIQPLQVTISKVENQKSYVSFSFYLLAFSALFLGLVIYVTFKLNIPFLSVYNNLSLGILLFTTGMVVQDYMRKLFLARLQILNALITDLLVTILHLSILTTILLNFKIDLVVIMYLGLAYIPSILLGIFLIKPILVAKAEFISYLKLHYHQSKWLLMTAIIQWWSSNFFVVASGVFLGLEMLGVFRFVQSLFGVLNLLLQTFENYLLPQTARLLVESRVQAKKYIRITSLKTAIPFASILVVLFIFSRPIIVLAGGPEYAPYDYVVKGMAVLYLFIFIGYPIRMAIRALILNKSFFIGYLISFAFSVLSFNFIIERWQLVGVISGLIMSQLLVISYWYYVLHKNNFSLWR